MPSSSKPAGIVASALVVIAAICGDAPAARGCPFCSAVSLTFAQEIAQSQAAVLARLVEPPTSGSLAPRAEGPLPKGKFAVVEVLKGSDLVQEAGFLGGDAKPIETILLEEKPIGTLFLLMGIEPPNLIWSSPIPISQQAVAYLKKLADLPEKGADRLAFFQQYLESPDETLARDAYDEFAVAPYADVRNLESRMDPTQLLEWIENPKIQGSRRRLYATMLGVCGTKADAARIEKILIGGETPKTPSASGADSDDDSAAIRDQAELRSGLDALIACSVTLRGADGLDLIDRLFLDRQGRDVPFTETYAAVMALRFLGEESDSVPRARVLQSLRLLLKEPKLADLRPARCRKPLWPLKNSRRSIQRRCVAQPRWQDLQGHLRPSSLLGTQKTSLADSPPLRLSVIPQERQCRTRQPLRTRPWQPESRLCWPTKKRPMIGTGSTPRGCLWPMGRRTRKVG
ncbi:MAG: hypothetical protein NTY25_03545 [Planctomycetia bacterium]|nr:hypothetical protein [Planctomycetia bacterium]